MADLVDLLRALVAINSVNPTLAAGPGERAIARWVAEWLGARGLAVSVAEAAPGRPNVVARVAGRGKRPPLLLNAHLDTVGIEGMDAPLTVRQVGDRLYGRGTYDMKGSVAVMLVLADHFAAQPPPGDLWLTFVSDEEDLSVGTEALVRDWLPTLDAPPAAAIVLEPTEERIGVAHKGFVWFEMAVTGRAGHGSRPDEATDAILPLGAALMELAALEHEFVAGPRHPLLGRPSLHASTVVGGSVWSVYPAQAVLRWERRTLPDEGHATLDAERVRVTEAARAVNDATVESRLVFQREPMGTPADAPVVRAFQRATPDAPLAGLSFWTDGALFHAAGLPTIIFGPIGHGAHAVDEWVSASSLARTVEVVRRVIEAGVDRATG